MGRSGEELPGDFNQGIFLPGECMVEEDVVEEGVVEEGGTTGARCGGCAALRCLRGGHVLSSCSRGERRCGTKVKAGPRCTTRMRSL